MRRTFLSGNPQRRMVPALSKEARSAKVATTDAAPAAAQDTEPDNVGEETIDNVATSNAIYEALVKIEGRVALDDARTENAIRILRGQKTDQGHLKLILIAIAALVVGVLLARPR